MSLTVSQVIVDAQYLTDESTIPSVTQALRLVNIARRDIAKETLCFLDTYSLSTVATPMTSILPSDVYKVKDIDYYTLNTPVRVLPVNQSQWEAFDLSTQADTFQYYKQDNSTLSFYPTSPVAQASTLSVQLQILDTTCTPVSTSNFPVSGRALVDVEVISWNGITSGVLQNVVHGLEGTTAALHNANAVITVRNVVIQYYKLPADLTSTSSNVESIFQTYENIIPYYLAWKMKLRDTDDVQATGSNAQAMKWEQLYNKEADKLSQDAKMSNDTVFTRRRLYR